MAAPPELNIPDNDAVLAAGIRPDGSKSAIALDADGNIVVSSSGGGGSNVNVTDRPARLLGAISGVDGAAVATAANPVPIAGVVTGAGGSALASATLQGAGLPVALGAGGGLKVDGSGTALPVAAAALPLPTGASTAALQGAGLPAAFGAGGGVKVDGSGTALPISAAALPLPSGAATSALQGAGLPSALSSGGGVKVGIVDGSVTVAGTATVAGTVAVSSVGGLVAVTNAGLTNIDVALSTRASQATVAALALESGGNLAAAKASLDSLVAAIGFGDPSFEVSRTSLWRTKAGACINIIGRRASFTANVQNDLVMFTPSAGSSTTINEMAGTETLEIISSSASDTAAGTGVRTVKITYIDALGTVGAQNTTTVTLNGTTAVSLGAVRALAIQWAEAATVGSGKVAAGDITIRATATPTNLYELISAGGNRSMSGRYMVPVGMSAYANEWQGSAVNQDMDIRLRGTVEMGTRASVSPYLFQDAMYPPTGSVSPSRALPWLKFPAGSKLKLSAMPTAVAGSPRCEGSISLVVITN